MTFAVPDAVYLDTSLIVAAVIGGDPHSPTCVHFCAALAAANASVYFSQILRVEVAQAIRRIATRRVAPPHLDQQYQLDRFPTDFMVRDRWMRYGMSELDRLLQTFAIAYELPLRTRIWRQAVSLMALHGLDALDAVHAATALRHQILDFAASDTHFQRVFGSRFHLVA